MQQSIMAQGFDLMLYGMGSVFVFLTLLVFATRFMSWLVNRFFPEPLAPIVNKPVPFASSPTVDTQVLAVIQNAIHQHRAKRA